MADIVARQRVYLDPNVFIRAFESPEVEAAPIRRMLEALRHDPKRAVTSELTLAEVLAPARTGPDLLIKRRFYLDLIVWSGFIDLLPVTRSILLETPDLRKVARHSLPDAIRVVSAIRAGCNFFMSNDKDMKANKIPHGMRALLPDSSGVVTILDALRA
ncbi:type II toxin-antitoxin system VapC family toxin [Methylocella silvestris]|uniref:PIN domain-containing protein n=1 Tax=Methylocella silvestris TaxID=199596 RepID=A0A2J7TMC6_METSI|nr:type II toxin-antitoxin system VapC family toxin [Methylocella silvestris]PNG27926.1 hypothetical protein CR492_03305 [Methylocella silvestris]